MGNVNGREEGENVIENPRRSDVDSGFSENSDRRTRVPSLDSMGNTPPESPGRSRSPLLFAPQVISNRFRQLGLLFLVFMILGFV